MGTGNDKYIVTMRSRADERSRLGRQQVGLGLGSVLGGLWVYLVKGLIEHSPSVHVKAIHKVSAHLMKVVIPCHHVHQEGRIGGSQS